MTLKWKKISVKSYRAGHRKLLRKKYRLPDGRQEIFDIKDEGKSVCILALTPDNKVILAKQYRPGPEKIVLDLPGGAIDKEETPFNAAKRELLEETGYAGKLIRIGTCLECGFSNKIRHNFVAINCRMISNPRLEKNEFIKTVLLSLKNFRFLLRSGKLTVIETGYMGLDKLGLL